MMKFRSFIGVACAAIAIANAMSPAVTEEGETVTKHFEQAIPNIPGKSLVAFVVDYAPGGASPSHRTRNRPSFSPMSCPEKSNRK